MPDCGFINTVVCPGESSWQAQEADGAERTRKESEKLVPHSSSPRSWFSSVGIAMFFSAFVHLHEKFFPPLLGPEDESWNGTRRRSADGSAAYESALISSQRGISFVFCLSVCSSAVWFLSFVFFLSAVFFFRFLSMTSPTVRKWCLPLLPCRRNANSANPKNASDLTRHRCNAFNLVFQ